MNDGTLLDSKMLPQKIVSIAAGEAHTLALTGDGSVYSWGKGRMGRLGSGSEDDQLFPVRIQFQSSSERINPRVTEIAAGGYHSLALTDDGSVWSWGDNVYGQLGHGEHSLVPVLLESFLEVGSSDSLTDEPEIKSKAPLKVSSVKAGGMVSMAIDNHGALWMWGNCPQRNSSSEDSFAPMPVLNFHGHSVVKVACGYEHVVALVSAGETYKGGDLVCYSWGNNNHGQLGLGDKASRLNPEVIQRFNQDSPWAAYEVACGAFHTAILAYKKSQSDTLGSACWTFGIGDNGQLGHGTTKSSLLPEPVKELPENVSLISVDCGLFHTSVVSSDGNVWSWGMEKGLGLCPDARFTGADSGDAVSPLLISWNGIHGPKFPRPVQVACGAAHTVLLAEDGYKLWAWGRGMNGVIGNGKVVDCFTPSIVLWPPLSEDIKEEVRDNVPGDAKSEEKDPEGIAEMDKRLSMAMEEITLLRSKLSVVERYASILHGLTFGKPFEEQDIPISLQNSGTFDIVKEWDNMLESADHSKLIRLEMFYRNMLAGVKDKLMKRRIGEIIKECLNSTARN